MDLKSYFATTKGTGVLSTADKLGYVDAAIYGRPHLLDDGRVAFIMADRLSHKNLQDNPRACYLFKEEGEGYQGKRLYVKKSSETDDQDKIAQLRRGHHGPCCKEASEKKYLVYFDIEKELPLVGGAEKSSVTSQPETTEPDDCGWICA
ncbi:MAG: pyridoxamine 5'-phosphate oxidase family protein [Candidatus Omnitrophica bacterium]|nr:pyridoxamine 5'-phosphate oxidase family protein [Candidatus Omnitrophota bacterium]